MGPYDFDAFEEDGLRAAGWDGAGEREEDEDDIYRLPGKTDEMGPQYRVEIALIAGGKWAEVDERDLAAAEMMVESLLVVLLQIFPSFSVELVRVRPWLAGEARR